MPNITLTWSMKYPTLVLSKGSTHLLMAFAQFQVRLLEQRMFTHYKPTLQPASNDITFFNVKLNPTHLDGPISQSNIYPAVDVTRTVIYAQ